MSTEPRPDVLEMLLRIDDLAALMTGEQLHVDGRLATPDEVALIASATSDEWRAISDIHEKRSNAAAFEMMVLDEIKELTTDLFERHPTAATLGDALANEPPELAERLFSLVAIVEDGER